ncbi:hypothetical protein QVD17_19931 [Tagetes erecta]|uniref:Cathepsin propeptide inhibitor domain-containing protein n=1 Tax=Tagetes erecta TaxID=13708 RepID=A0AAD8KN76_TARER|nr:hypothetical protein QVD17_19931 [Tagetes erecta]
MALLLKKPVLMQRLICFPPISRHSKGFSSSSPDEMKSRFELWMVEHGKYYNTVEEKEKRFKIFKGKVRAIEKHNYTFLRFCKKHLTKFSDQTWDELHFTFCLDRSTWSRGSGV